MECRVATFADIEALAAIAEDRAYFEQCFAEQDAGRRTIVILNRDGADVGYAFINWNPQYSLYRKLSIPEIQDLNVHPDARRQGCGAALIEYCEEYIRARGFTEAGICVGLHARFGAAQRLYVRLGYMPDGYGVTYDRQTVGAGDMRPVDDNLCLMMVKDLAVQG